VTRTAEELIEDLSLASPSFCKRSFIEARLQNSRRHKKGSMSFVSYSSNLRTIKEIFIVFKIAF
jgi:hypothetical protein